MTLFSVRIPVLWRGELRSFAAPLLLITAAVAAFVVARHHPRGRMACFGGFAPALALAAFLAGFLIWIGLTDTASVYPKGAVFGARRGRLGEGATTER